MTPSRRRYARVILVTCLIAAAHVGGIAAAPPSLAQPSTVLERLEIAAGRLLPSGPGTGLELRGPQIVASSKAVATAPVRVCAPIWFTAMGVTWDQQRGAPFELQAATSRGRTTTFGRTYRLDAESGPDPGSAEYRRGSAASTMLWTGGSRCARVRLDLGRRTSISDLQIHFLNTSGSAEGPRTGPANIDPAAVPAPDRALATGAARTSSPRLITRQQWGARPGLMNCEPDVADEVRAGFVHHTAGTNHYSRNQTDDIIRSIYAYHTRGQGWCDIAYNFLVDKYGRAYEGRSGGVTEPVVGAAQQGFNTRAFSVSLLGTFTRTRPSPKMQQALRRVLAWRLDVAHVNPKGRGLLVSAGGSNTRFRAGTEVNVPAIVPHRFTGYTDCPGAKVVNRLREIRRKVARMGLPKIYKPTVEPAVVKLGSNPLRIRAAGSQSLRWDVSVHEADGDELFSFPSSTGPDLDLRWQGSDTTPYPREAGSYSIVVRGETSGGNTARPATLTFKVKPGAV
ncbi:MAG: peptidoglycan recognition protein [Actinomycetota bacterium]